MIDALVAMRLADMSATHPAQDESRVCSKRGRLHVVCYCLRGETRRVISFRKANKREERFYAEEKAAVDR